VPGNSPPSSSTAHPVPVSACKAGPGPGLPAAGTGTCQVKQVCSNPTTDQTVGFQPLTVQPVLEAWVEGMKKDFLQRQELMFQMLR